MQKPKLSTLLGNFFCSPRGKGWSRAGRFPNIFGNIFFKSLQPFENQCAPRVVLENILIFAVHLRRETTQKKMKKTTKKASPADNFGGKMAKPFTKADNPAADKAAEKPKKPAPKKKM